MWGARWTDEEIALLREIYPQRGINGVKGILVRHSERAIYRQAYRLRLASGAIWSDEEDRKLIELYPHMGKRCAREFPKRSWLAIVRRAARLGLRTA